MIDITNLHCDLTPEGRRTALQRAIYTQPYFYRMSIPVDNESKAPFFEQTLGINRDFYLTEIQANFGEVFADVNTAYDITIYSAYNHSVYRYEAGRKLPSGFICEEARLQQAQAGNSYFDDRQHENFPFLIRANDKVYVRIKNQTVSNTSDTVELILKGFNVLDDVVLTPMQTDQCNDSLSREVEWQYFKLDIDRTGLKSYIIENDNQTRLLLGFGASNNVAEVPKIEITLIETARRLRLTDTKIPLQFIAPRSPNCFDTHIYYLPTEYWLQPYAKLQFDVLFTPSGQPIFPVEIEALTRTA